MGWKSKEAKRAYEKWYYHTHKSDHMAAQRRWRAKDPIRTRSYRLKRYYGLSAAKVEELSASQNHCCAICGEPFKQKAGRGGPHVDHCHITKIVRGVLCNKCNMAIGLMRDSPTIALEAAHYLNRTPQVSYG
jgi:Recombination endonuclease VII